MDGRRLHGNITVYHMLSVRDKAPNSRWFNQTFVMHILHNLGSTRLLVFPGDATPDEIAKEVSKRDDTDNKVEWVLDKDLRSDLEMLELVKRNKYELVRDLDPRACPPYTDLDYATRLHSNLKRSEYAVDILCDKKKLPNVRVYKQNGRCDSSALIFLKSKSICVDDYTSQHIMQTGESFSEEMEQVRKIPQLSTDCLKWFAIFTEEQNSLFL